MAVNARSLRPRSRGLTSPRQIAGLALWLDASATETLLPVSDAAIGDDFSPYNFSGQLPQLWVSADNPSNTVSGGRVVGLADMAGNADPMSTYLYSNSAITAPLLVPNALGGRPVMRFNGTTDGLMTMPFLQDIALTLVTVAVVRVNSSSAVMQSVLAVEDYNQSIAYISVAANSSSLLGSSTSFGTNFRADAPKPVIVVTTFNPDNAERNVYHNGRLVSTGTDPDTFTETHYISLGRGPEISSGNPASCDIAEAIAYTEALSVAEINQLTLWLGNKYNIVTDVSPASMTTTAVNAPTEIGGLTEWFDATDTSGTVTTVAGNKVSSWASKVAGGRTLTQGNDTLRPVMTDNIQNGLRMAKFDGVDDFIRTATPETFADKTVFIVARPTDVSATQAVWGASKQNITVYGYYYSAGFRVNSASALVRPETAGVPSRRIAASANEAIITSLQFKTSELVAGTFSSFAPYKNGTLFDNNDSVALADYGIGSTMGANDSRPAAGVLSNFYSGYVGEVLIYDAFLSAVDRARVEKYLQQKWATPAVPDPTPPVGYWGDRSGNGRHAVQATAARRPSVIMPTGGTEMVNGRQALWASGSGFSGMSLGNVSGAFPNSSGTAFFAYKVSAGTTSAGIDNTYSLAMSRANNVNSTNTDTGEEGLWRTTRLASYNSTALPRASFGASIYTIRSAADEYSLRSKGAQFFSTGTQNWNAGNSYHLWSDPDGTMTPLGGWIGEAIFYNRALSVLEVQRVERYLATRWGITLAPQVANADAQNWIDRVYANGGTVSSATAASVNTFCESIASAGIRDRFFRLNLFCGSFQGAFVPLFRGPSLGGTQYGGTTDTNEGGLFVTANYNETGASGGLQGASASSKRLRTGLAQNTMPTGNLHIAAYEIAKSNASSDTSVGARNNSLGQYSELAMGGNTSTALFYNVGTGFATASDSGYTQAGGFLMGVSVSTALTLYKNGSSAATGTVSAAASTSSTFAVFSTESESGTGADFTNARLGGYSIGLAMTAPQAAAYYTAMQAFQAALTRNV